MNILKPILRIGSRFQEIEFSLLLAWALLFPDKLSYFYYLGFMALLVLFSLKKIFTQKNISLMHVSVFLLLFNLQLIGSAFFSCHPGKSFLFICDVLLLSLWFSLFDFEKNDVHRYLRLLAYLISISSLVIIVLFAWQAGRGSMGTIFKNPILQGVAAALAVLFFLQSLLQKFNYAELALLLINGTAMIVSASKAAFLGLALFSVSIIFSRRRKWLIYFFAVLLLLLLIPNPLQRMFNHSLKYDPYVFNRLDIWKMSAYMFHNHPWTGVGPDLFNEAAKRFNFPQGKGPSRYGKLPESPHSDYWKIITETGFTGLIFVILFLFFTVRRMLAPPWFDLAKIILAFLLLQMFLFNFIFNIFFLLVFLFLLYSFYWQRLRFVSLTPVLKIFFSGLLLLVFLIFYLLPFVADRLLQQANVEKNIVRRFAMLNRAGLLSPFDERVPLARAQILRGFFKATANLDAWEAAWKDSRLAQKLDRNSSEACILESGLFQDILEKRIMYPALAGEILTPLRRAEKLEPFNPFLKLQQALILSEFGRQQEARLLAITALKIEPDYVAALFFMQQTASSSAEKSVFQRRIAQIQAKTKILQAKPGSYLYELHHLPDKSGTRN